MIGLQQLLADGAGVPTGGLRVNVRRHTGIGPCRVGGDLWSRACEQYYNEAGEALQSATDAKIILRGTLLPHRSHDKTAAESVSAQATSATPNGARAVRCAPKMVISLPAHRD